MLPPSTEYVVPEVMVTPLSVVPLTPWIAAPLAAVRLPPLIVASLRMTDEELSVEIVPPELLTVVA